MQLRIRQILLHKITVGRRRHHIVFAVGDENGDVHVLESREKPKIRNKLRDRSLLLRASSVVDKSRAFLSINLAFCSSLPQ